MNYYYIVTAPIPSPAAHETSYVKVGAVEFLWLLGVRSKLCDVNRLNHCLN